MGVVERMYSDPVSKKEDVYNFEDSRETYYDCITKTQIAILHINYMTEPNLVNARKDSPLHIPLKALPLLTIPPRAILIQHRHSPRHEIKRLSNPHNQPSHNPTSRQTVRTTPERIPTIVDMSRPAPKPRTHDLALVGGIILEPLTLDLCRGFEGDAHGVDDGADEEGPGDGCSGEGWCGEGCCGGGEEEEGVGCVDEGVVGADGEGGCGREVLLGEADEPVGLL